MRLNDSHLTFGKIADEWARELEEGKTSGRFNRDEIFLEMDRSVWRGQFADMILTIEQAPKYDKDGQRYKPTPMRVTREMLDKMVLLRSGVRPCDPNASRWEFRVALKLEDYQPQSLQVWFEPLTISREHFGQWCNDHEHQRPVFWFGKPNKAGRPSTKTEIEEIYETLRDAGEVDYDASRNAIYGKIRSNAGTERKGFGDEAIRKAIKPLFKRDKKLRRNQ